MPVGAYRLAVSLNGQNSTARVVVYRLCREGQFGLPGRACGSCPEVRMSSVSGCQFCGDEDDWVRLRAAVCRVSRPLALMQNAACVAMFPVPLPLPGFYSSSLTSFSSCVPASACPGVDAQLVSATFRALLQGGPNELRQVSGWGLVPVGPPPLPWVSRPA